MFAYIKGEITQIGSYYVFIECNNIGYKIRTANPFIYEETNTYKIYTYQHIREDINELYGFSTYDEQKLFSKLISVKGIGPKSALSILATGSVKLIKNAIESGDVAYLMHFPGIGIKASQQIILDLKGKIELSDKIERNLNDVVEALKALGYKQKEIDKVINKISLDLKADEQIKEALSLMLK